MIQIVNGSIAQSHWRAGLCRLFDDSIILVGNPSACRVLAFAPSLTVSRAAAALDRSVDRGCTCHGYLAPRCAVLRSVGLVPAAFLFGAGFWLYSKSGQDFSIQQLSGIPEVMPGAREQRLITAGIHSRVRHPAYLAHFCEMLAWRLRGSIREAPRRPKLVCNK